MRTDDQSLKDPVCGMKVTVQSPNTLKHQGTQVYFSGPACMAKFPANPAKHPISPDAAGVSSTTTTKPVAPGVIYTCPMHPQIRQVGPGSCPICGMALDPADPAVGNGTNPELVDMRRRFWIGVPLGFVVLMLAMRHDILGLAAIANTVWSKPSSSS